MCKGGNVQPPQIFLSHTDSDEFNKQATTAILVELRSLGLDVWIDREHAAPYATPEQIAKGPVPDNPLFGHIVKALSECDAVFYIASPASFLREYVRLEFDPRIISQEFHAKHPEIPFEKLPIFILVISPIKNPPHYWSEMINQFKGRIFDLSGCPNTPLLLRSVLQTIVSQIDKDYLLPVDPFTCFIIRKFCETDANNAPGCPPDVPANVWRKLESYLGLGPCFINDYHQVDTDQINYSLNAISSMASLDMGIQSAITEEYHMMLALWSANLMVRSKIFRYQDKKDIPVEYSFQGILKKLTYELNELNAAVYLQLGFCLLTSEIEPDLAKASEFFLAAGNYFSQIEARSLAALTLLLNGRTKAYPNKIESPKLDQVVLDEFDKLNEDPFEPDIYKLYFSVLDKIFPGPRIETTEAYRKAAKSFNKSLIKASKEFKAGFAKPGDEKWNPEFWEPV
jgi:hypothetical protein